MANFSAVPSHLELSEKYLQQLCLYTFQKNVFSHIKSVLHPERIEVASAGEVRLYYEGLSDALTERNRPPRLAHGHRLAVKNIEVLFARPGSGNMASFSAKDGMINHTI